jgi:hypothetical protein
LRRTWLSSGWFWLPLAATLALSACTANRKHETPTPTPTAVAHVIAPSTPKALRPTPGPAATPTPTLTTAPRATLSPGDHLFARGGPSGNAQQGLVIINGNTGEREQSLLSSVVSPDWSALYAVDVQNGATTLLARDPIARPGDPPLRQRLIQGEYQLLAPDVDGTAGGLSANGKWLVLGGRSNVSTSGGLGRGFGASDRFVVSDTAFAGGMRGVILNGMYRFLAISNDGNNLYLLESPSQGQGRFATQVRLYDLKRSHLAEQPLVDQNNNAVMLGPRLANVSSPDGQWLYSLDSSGEGPSVYALNLAGHTLTRLALPQGGGPGTRFAMRASLLMAPDAKTLYVVNSGTGSIVEIDTAGLTVRDSQAVVLPGRPPDLSGMRSPTPGPGTRGGAFRQMGFRSSILSPDGRTLYVTGNSGLAAINAAHLTLRGYYLPDVPLASLAFSPDGARLYALSTEAGKIIRLDPETGTRLHEIPSPGQIWALMHVETAPSS